MGIDSTSICGLEIYASTYQYPLVVPNKVVSLVVEITQVCIVRRDSCFQKGNKHIDPYDIPCYTSFGDVIYRAKIPSEM